MKVFISWSGERARQVAVELKRWLPLVVHTSEPFMSQTDIDKGTPWFNAIRDAVIDAGAGIIVVTPENVNEPWIQFEAGGLAFALDKRACPLVVGMSTGELPATLGNLNVAKTSREDMLRLAQTLRPANVDDQALVTCFDQFWPDLEGVLRRVEAEDVGQSKRAERTAEEMFTEIVDALRAVNRPIPRVRDYTPFGDNQIELLPTDYQRYVMTRAITDFVLERVGRSVPMTIRIEPDHTVTAEIGVDLGGLTAADMESLRTDLRTAKLRELLITAGDGYWRITP